MYAWPTPLEGEYAGSSRHPGISRMRCQAIWFNPHVLVSESRLVLWGPIGRESTTCGSRIDLVAQVHAHLCPAHLGKKGRTEAPQLALKRLRSSEAKAPVQSPTGKC